MKEYIYPAIFHKNNDNSFTVSFPDLPGCITEGKNIGNALKMAHSALAQWIEFLKDENETLPIPSNYKNIITKENEIISLVQVDIKNTKSVKRTISLPKWMDEKLSEAGFSLSKLVQEAAKQKLKLINA